MSISFFFQEIITLYNAECDNWMRLKRNAAKTIAMHNIPGIARATGIFIFTEEDFLPSQISDRPKNEMRQFTPEEMDEQKDCCGHHLKIK